MSTREDRLNRRRLKGALKICVSGALLLIVWRTVVSEGSLAETLRWANPSSLLVAAGILAAGQAVAALRLHYVLLRLRRRIGFLPILRAHFVGIWFNQVLPTSIGGDAVKVLVLRRPGDTVRITRGVLLSRGFGLIALLATVSLLVPFYDRILIRARPFYAIAVVSLILLAALGLAVHLSRISGLARKSARLVRFLPLLLRDMQRFVSPRLFWGQVWTSGLVVLSVVVCFMFLGRAVGHNISIGACLVVVPPIILSMHIPLSYGGWGIREVGAVALLPLAGVPADTAFLMSVLYGAAFLMSGLLGLMLWHGPGSGRADGTRKGDRRPGTAKRVPGGLAASTGPTGRTGSEGPTGSDVLILGGGFAGLAAAYELGLSGVRSIILEKEPHLGGLAACSTIDGIPVEHFYHHIKPEDAHLVDLIGRLGLIENLHWIDTRMGFYVNSRFFPFSTPMDLLRFSPLSLADRFRFALGVFKAKRTDGRKLEGMNAEEWVSREWSRSIYERMMRPMLLNKFGIPPARISAGFFQGRIKGLSSAKTNVRGGEHLAYLHGSLQPLIDRLEDEVRRTSDLLVETPVEGIVAADGGFRVSSGSREFTASYVVNTLPLTAFQEIPKNFEFETAVEYQAVVCVAFSIEEDLTPLYWINVLDDGIAFRVLVNQSRLADYPHSVVYSASYVRPEDPLFEKSDGEILSLFTNSLERMFGGVTVRAARVFRSRYATPVFDKDFAAKTHDLDTRVPGMFFAGNVKVYPYTRTVSSVIGTGYAAAQRVVQLVEGSHGGPPLHHTSVSTL